MGVSEQLRREGRGAPAATRRALDAGTGLFSLRVEGERVEVGEGVFEERVGDEAEELAKLRAVFDEITGEHLPEALVQAARADELQFMDEWRVWDEASVEECWRETGRRPLGGRWVDVDKGGQPIPWCPFTLCRSGSRRLPRWRFLRGDAPP